MRHSRILVVDDDLAILKFLKASLETRGCEVVTAVNGAEALQAAGRGLPDLVILDVMMPEMDGFEACQRLRQWSQIPVIMLSAKDEVRDKVRCLDLGADDYITKPFGVTELMARVRSVLRRVRADDPVPVQPSFVSGGLGVDFTCRRVTVAGNEVRLTPTEFSLLRELVLNSERVLTYSYLLNKVWGPEYRAEREYLHVFIRRLRAKLETDPKNPRYFVTVPAVGYQFRAIPLEGEVSACAGREN